MNKKPTEKPASKPVSTTSPPGPVPAKKKLSLDVSEVSEVLERKISP